MSLIIGMDYGVFLAWILTIFSAVSCVLYGIYMEFMKKPSKKDKQKKKEEK